MKICYIASPSIHTTRWLRYFVEKGHEVHLITTTCPFDNSLTGVNIHYLRRFGPQLRVANYLINSIPLLLQFRRLLKRINPDILHAHQIMDTSLLGAVSGFYPYVVTPWGSDILITPQQSVISRWIAKYVLTKADLITCSAEYLRKSLIKVGVDPGRAVLIYLGVDVGKFTSAPKDERLGGALGMLGAPVVISLRHLEPMYDVESLIRAVPLVLKEMPRVKFLIAEKGSQEEELRQLVESLGVTYSIRFIGRVPNDEIPRYICLADVYVSTSLSDGGLSASTAEAMACGLPVVITATADNRLWVEDGVNGFIIPLRDPAALAAKIIYLLQNEAIRDKFGQAGRRVIEERNNWELEMEKMGSCMRAWLRRRKAETLLSR